MADLEKVRHAKSYMEALAEGIDPISGEVLPKDTLLNNVQLSRCFFYVSEVLRQVIENGGVVNRYSRSKAFLPPFILPSSLRCQIAVTESPVMIRHFTQRINSLVDVSKMRRLKETAFTLWLLNNGYFSEEIRLGKKKKIPTSKGVSIGIYSEEREGQYGGYLAILYKESAQRFLVNNLDQIIALSNGEEDSIYQT